MSMNGFFGNLRFAIRQLASRPGFTAVAILTLALGIGANATVFSFLSGYLLKPLPYPDADRLVQVYSSVPNVRSAPFGVSLPLSRVLRTKAQAFSAAGFYHYGTFDLNNNGHARHVYGIYSSASLFQVLDIHPLLGRLFTEKNMQRGNNMVALISYGLWQSSFGGDPDVIGKTIHLDDGLHRVIGVMPKNFAFPARNMALWVPYMTMPGGYAPNHAISLNVNFIGRLKPGISSATAQTRIRHAVDTYFQTKAPANIQKMVKGAGFTMEVKSWRHVLLSGRTTTLWLLQGAVLLILLMTCVNVANLLLARILDRSHEIALRNSLGATRAVLARQLLHEALVLAVPGGLIGIGLAWLATYFLNQTPLGTGTSVFNIALDWRVVLFTLTAVLLTATLVSLLPIRHLANTDLRTILQEGGRSGNNGRNTRRVRNALVIAQLTLATGLLATSGLLLHSFTKLESVNTGFRKDHVLVAHLLIPHSDQAARADLDSFYTSLIKRAKALPDVRQAAVANAIPMGDNFDFAYSTFYIPGEKVSASGKPPTAWRNNVSRGFFKTLGIPLLRGRNFSAGDKDKYAVIIGNGLARKYFAAHGVDPLGHTVRLYGQNAKKYTIIGIVPALKYGQLSQTSGSVMIYVPNKALRVPYFILHTSLPPEALVKPLKELVASMDPGVAVYDIHSLRDQLSTSLNDQRTTMGLLLAFALIALLLAIVGVYAVMSYAVMQRRAECGIRKALGALPGNLLWMVLLDGLKLLGIGLAAGLVLTVIFGASLSSLLFGVAPYDPLTLVGVMLLMSATTVLACYLPARRMAKLNPAAAIFD